MVEAKKQFSNTCTVRHTQQAELIVIECFGCFDCSVQVLGGKTPIRFEVIRCQGCQPSLKRKKQRCSNHRQCHSQFHAFRTHIHILFVSLTILLRCEFDGCFDNTYVVFCRFAIAHLFFKWSSSECCVPVALTSAMAVNAESKRIAVQQVQLLAPWAVYSHANSYFFSTVTRLGARAQELSGLSVDLLRQFDEEGAQQIKDVIIHMIKHGGHMPTQHRQHGCGLSALQYHEYVLTVVPEVLRSCLEHTKAQHKRTGLGFDRVHQCLLDQQVCNAHGLFYTFKVVQDPDYDFHGDGQKVLVKCFSVPWGQALSFDRLLREKAEHLEALARREVFSIVESAFIEEGCPSGFFQRHIEFHENLGLDGWTADLFELFLRLSCRIPSHMIQSALDQYNSSGTVKIVNVDGEMVLMSPAEASSAASAPVAASGSATSGPPSSAPAQTVDDESMHPLQQMD